MVGFLRSLLGGAGPEPQVSAPTAPAPQSPPGVDDQPTIERIAVARLKPGDVIVVECRGLTSIQEVESIKATLRPIFPGHKVVVCDEGTRLRFAGPEEVEEIEGAEV